MKSRKQQKSNVLANEIATDYVGFSLFNAREALKHAHTILSGFDGLEEAAEEVHELIHQVIEIHETICVNLADDCETLEVVQ